MPKAQYQTMPREGSHLLPHNKFKNGKAFESTFIYEGLYPNTKWKSINDRWKSDVGYEITKFTNDTLRVGNKHRLVDMMSILSDSDETDIGSEEEDRLLINIPTCNNADQRTDEWHAARARRINASELSELLGFWTQQGINALGGRYQAKPGTLKNAYRRVCAMYRTLHQDKTPGLAELSPHVFTTPDPDKFDGNVATKWGEYHEANAFCLLAHVCNNTLHEVGSECSNETVISKHVRQLPGGQN